MFKKIELIVGVYIKDEYDIITHIPTKKKIKTAYYFDNILQNTHWNMIFMHVFINDFMWKYYVFTILFYHKYVNKFEPYLFGIVLINCT